MQREANENQARFQEQLGKKDEEMAQVQRQLLEVLQNRPQPQPQPRQPLGPNIIINNRDQDPNIPNLYKWEGPTMNKPHCKKAGL